jgi:hypothetical protein
LQSPRHRAPGAGDEETGGVHSIFQYGSFSFRYRNNDFFSYNRYSIFN